MTIRNWLYTVARRLRVTGPVWDWEFRHGRLVHFAKKSQTTLELVQRHSKGGKIVELGCAAGALPSSLPPGSFREYVGIDVSTVAVEQATKLGLRGCTFRTESLEEWRSERADLIVIEEVLYYLSPAAQKTLLARCLESVRPDGVVLVVVCDLKLHAETMARARGAGRIVEEVNNGLRGYVVVA